jgi:hypothetical protein
MENFYPMATPQFFKALVDIPPTSIGEQLVLAQSLLISCFIHTLSWSIPLVGIISVAKFALTFHWKVLK